MGIHYPIKPYLMMLAKSGLVCGRAEELATQSRYYPENLLVGIEPSNPEINPSVRRCTIAPSAPEDVLSYHDVRDEELPYFKILTTFSLTPGLIQVSIDSPDFRLGCDYYIHQTLNTLNHEERKKLEVITFSEFEDLVKQ